MSDEEPEEIVDLDTVDEELEAQYRQMMEMNADMLEKATKESRKLLRIAERYDDMAQRARAAATLVYVTAQQLVVNAGDLLSSEFGIEVTEADPDEADDDSEDENDE